MRVQGRVIAAVVSGLLAGVRATPAAASSEAAWSAFRTDVARVCTAAAAQSLVDPFAVVDAFGSEHYGFAIVYGRERGPKGSPPSPGLGSLVCVYEKKTKRVELSGIMQTNFAARPR
ncbi:MAG: hypothetical protein ACREM2_08045 [Vulcanimicrobiaceae bacterium]